jgi:hypothetical protein
MIYPFFLGPEEHRLFSYYRRINLWSYIFFPMIIALNELLIRPRLPAYRESPERFWSMLALLLNAQVPASVGVSIHVTLGLCALCLATTFVLLPKWGLRAAKISVKHGLPAYAEYKAAYFYFENSIQRFGFFMWHSVLMPVSFFFGVFVPCMVISLFRSLS